MLTSEGIGDSATRRQLAVIALPVIAGWLLPDLTEARQVGPAVAMALLVTGTSVPLALLIPRDGRVLDELDRARRDEAMVWESLTGDMRVELAGQAEALARESEDRIKAETPFYHRRWMGSVGHRHDLRRACAGHFCCLRPKIA